MKMRHQPLGLKPADRPTEWSVAVTMLGIAAVMFANDRDVAALTATASACLPAIITALVEYVRGRARDAADTDETDPALD